jgi:hypothetical protein
MMNFKTFFQRKPLFIGITMGLVIVLIVLALASSRSTKPFAEIKMLAGQGDTVTSSVLLSATNQGSRDYAFSCHLQIQTKSGWSDVSPSDEIRTLRYFRKGQVVQLRVGLPTGKGLYRFRCFYEPSWGTTWSTRMHDRLMGLRLPGKPGVGYRELMGRLQPWPKYFYSRVIEIKGNAQPARTSQPPPSLSALRAMRNSALPGFVEARPPSGCGLSENVGPCPQVFIACCALRGQALILLHD